MLEMWLKMRLGMNPMESGRGDRDLKYGAQTGRNVLKALRRFIGEHVNQSCQRSIDYYFKEDAENEENKDDDASADP